MAILSALQSAAVRLIGRKPGTFYGADGKFEMEICDLVNEVADDIAKYQDWQALMRFGVITGDGEAEDFDLPSDYDRMMVVSDVQDTASWAWGYQQFVDINAFRFMRTRGFTPYPGGWIIYANQMHFSPAPTPSAVAEYPYISKFWARPATGADQAQFSSDTDSFLLPERLLTLGLIWRWRADIKKLDASGDMEAFTKALDEYASKDKGSRVMRRNSRRIFPGTYPAWPWALG